jgi:hypothetical protein
MPHDAVKYHRFNLHRRRRVAKTVDHPTGEEAAT